MLLNFLNNNAVNDDYYDDEGVFWKHLCIDEQLNEVGADALAKERVLEEKIMTRFEEMKREKGKIRN